MKESYVQQTSSSLTILLYFFNCFLVFVEVVEKNLAFMLLGFSIVDLKFLVMEVWSRNFVCEFSVEDQDISIFNL